MNQVSETLFLYAIFSLIYAFTTKRINCPLINSNAYFDETLKHLRMKMAGTIQKIDEEVK